MKTNQGTTERVVRVLLGVALLAVGYWLPDTASAPAIALMAIGVILAATGLVAYCPAWHLLGIDTRRTGR